MDRGLTFNYLLLQGFPTQPPKNYVSYGCWFWPFGMWAHHKHSNIFIRLGSFFRGEHGIIQNKFGLPGGSDKVRDKLRFRL